MPYVRVWHVLLQTAPFNQCREGRNSFMCKDRIHTQPVIIEAEIRCINEYILLTLSSLLPLRWRGTSQDIRQHVSSLTSYPSGRPRGERNTFYIIFQAYFVNYPSTCYE